VVGGGAVELGGVVGGGAGSGDEVGGCVGAGSGIGSRLLDGGGAELGRDDPIVVGGRVVLGWVGIGGMLGGRWLVGCGVRVDVRSTGGAVGMGDSPLGVGSTGAGMPSTWVGTGVALVRGTFCTVGAMFGADVGPGVTCLGMWVLSGGGGCGTRLGAP
jgi:hypothetical protein